MPGFLFNTLSEAAPFEPVSLSPGNYVSFGDNKHQYIKQFELTKELLLISLTQLLEASTELVLFSHEFNPNLNIIALADVSPGRVGKRLTKFVQLTQSNLI